MHDRREIVEILIQSGLNFRRDEELGEIMIPTSEYDDYEYLVSSDNFDFLRDLDQPGSLKLLVESRCRENDSLMELRRNLIKNLDTKISFNDIIIKAVA